MKIILLSALVVLSACSPRPQRHKVIKADGSYMEPTGTPGGASAEEANIEPLDTYLSIGPYLQKEIDKTDNPSKIVKVFVLMRQETIVSKNFDTFKEALLPKSPTVSTAIELAQKNNVSTVEIEVEIGVLKTALALIPKAVSSMELSLASITDK